MSPTKLYTLMPRIDMPARLLILGTFSCQHPLYSGQHDHQFQTFQTGGPSKCFKNQERIVHFFYTTYLHTLRVQNMQRTRPKKVLQCNFKLFCWHTFVSNLIFFHPTCLFRPTCLIFMQNCLPNMFIQDNTSIRGIRVVSVS